MNAGRQGAALGSRTVSEAWTWNPYKTDVLGRGKRGQVANVG
jgi:hypothetical protein